jgi:hypothetical protein
MATNPKRDDLAAYSKWLAVQNAAWSAPATPEAALRKIESEPAIWLNQAVDVMAFGDGAAATDPMEKAAGRCQASRALCEAARRDEVKLIGSPSKPGDSSEPIPRPYFDTPRQLDDQDNSLGTNLDALSDDEFTIARAGGHQRWFNVRAETNSLVLWLRGFVPARELELPIEAYMIQPMTKPGMEGYVPLSSALLWIMTNGGSTRMSLQDNEAWTAASNRLLPLISTGQVEIIGRPVDGGTTKVISGVTFAGVAIDFPLRDTIDVLVGDDPWIGTNVYVDEEYWKGGFNDQLFARKAAPAKWTHLQVKKEDVLNFFKFASPPASESPTLEKLPPKQQTVVRFLRKNCPARNYGDFGTVKQLIRMILAERPGLKTLDEKTFREARAFFENDLSAENGSR